MLPEAGLAAAIRNADGEQIAIILGQADRIDLGDTGAAIFDYKSGIQLADGAEKPAHLAQLACYRLALQRLYPASGVRAAIFDVDSGHTKEASLQDADAALQRVLDSIEGVTH